MFLLLPRAFQPTKALLSMTRNLLTKIRQIQKILLTLLTTPTSTVNWKHCISNTTELSTMISSTRICCLNLSNHLPITVPSTEMFHCQIEPLGLILSKHECILISQLLQFNVPRYHALVFYLEDAQCALSMGCPNLLIGETRSHPHGAVQLCCAPTWCCAVVLCVVAVHSATHLDYYISLPSLFHLTVLVFHSFLKYF